MTDSSLGKFLRSMGDVRSQLGSQGVESVAYDHLKQVRSDPLTQSARSVSECQPPADASE